MDSNQLPNSPDTMKNVQDFLRTHPIGVLSTITPAGKPHGVVIYFSISDDFSITFLTKKNTLKSQNISADNRVMLVAYEASSQTTVQVSGTAHDITDNREAGEVFKSVLDIVNQTSDSGLPPISHLDAGHYVAYKIVPKHISMAVFARPDSGMSEVFEELNF